MGVEIIKVRLPNKIKDVPISFRPLKNLHLELLENKKKVRKDLPPLPVVKPKPVDLSESSEVESEAKVEKKHRKKKKDKKRKREKRKREREKDEDRDDAVAIEKPKKRKVKEEVESDLDPVILAFGEPSFGEDSENNDPKSDGEDVPVESEVSEESSSEVEAEP